MENTTYIALSRQAALMRKLEVIANNMANTNTTAFKSDEMLFREYLVPTRSTKHTVGDKLSFVQDTGLLRNTQEGPLVSTGNTFDLAIHGDSYFQVETEAGMRYTRNGHFRTDDAGMLVDSKGNAVMDSNERPIIFSPNESNITITPDGSVTTNNGVIAKLKAVHFDNPQKMRRIGDGLYDSVDDPVTVDRPEIAQGMLEQSNVQPVMEMTNLIAVTREYESNQKIIEAESTRRQQAMQVLSGAQASAA
jgi:flagellar basal-body rod protein FlgF